MRRQTYGYLLSRKSSPPVGWYQIILLGDRGTCVYVCQHVAQGCTRQRGGWDSNPRHTNRVSGTQTGGPNRCPPSHKGRVRMDMKFHTSAKHSATYLLPLIQLPVFVQLARSSKITAGYDWSLDVLRENLRGSLARAFYTPDGYPSCYPTNSVKD